MPFFQDISDGEKYLKVRGKKSIPTYEDLFEDGLADPIIAFGKDDSKGGDSKGGDSKGGDSKGGDSKGGDSKGGDSKGGDSKGGDSKGGDSKGGDSKGGDSKGGDSKGGDSKGGDSKGGDSKGGSSKGGPPAKPPPKIDGLSQREFIGSVTVVLLLLLFSAGTMFRFISWGCKRTKRCFKRTCCRKKRKVNLAAYSKEFGALDKLIFEEKPNESHNATDESISKFADQTAEEFSKKSKRVGDKLALGNKLV